MNKLNTSWSSIVRLVAQEAVNVEKGRSHKEWMNMEGDIYEIDMQGSIDDWCIDANSAIKDTELPDMEVFALAYRNNRLDELIDIVEDIMPQESYKVEASKGCPLPDAGEDFIRKDIILELSD